MNPRHRIKLQRAPEIEPEDFIADVDPAGFLVCQVFGHQPEGHLVGNALLGRCGVCGVGFCFRSNPEEESDG